MNSRRLCIGVLLALCVTSGVPATALAAHSLAGTYRTKITHTQAFNGKWTLHLSKLASTGAPTTGSYTLTHRHTLIERGSYTVKGNEVTFTADFDVDNCGPTPEPYAWKLKGKKLSFIVIASPPCLARSFVLHNVFTRVS